MLQVYTGKEEIVLTKITQMCNDFIFIVLDYPHHSALIRNIVEDIVHFNERK